MKITCKIHREEEFEINSDGDAFCKECIQQSFQYIDSKIKYDLDIESTKYSMGAKVPYNFYPKKIYVR